MSGGTKTFVVLLMGGLLLTGLVMIARDMRGGSLSGQPRPPQYVLDRRMERIDQNTFEVEDLSLGEWMKRGEKDGKYRSKRGKYTMVPVLICGNCNRKIPMPDLPMGPDMDPLKHDEMMMNYRCPLCGKQAQTDMAGIPPPPGVPRSLPPDAPPPTPAR